MRIAEGLEMLQISDGSDQRSALNLTLMWDQTETVLVDTGFPGQIELIRKALKSLGLQLRDLTKVILTHQDIDHIGSLPVIVGEHPGKIQVLCHPDEKPYIQGDKLLQKFDHSKREELLRANPDSITPFERLQLDPPHAAVTETVNDLQVLPFCGGVTVIHVPGHTPGHIGLYHQNSKTLLTGDSLNKKDGCLIGPRPEFTANMPQAIASLEKYQQFEIRNAICYHGGLVTGDVNAMIAQIIKGD